MDIRPYGEGPRSEAALLACCTVLGDAAPVELKRERGGVVIDVLEGELNVGVPHESLSTFVLGEGREPPLSLPVRRISVQGLHQPQQKPLTFMTLLQTNKLNVGDQPGRSRLHQQLRY